MKKDQNIEIEANKIKDVEANNENKYSKEENIKKRNQFSH
jgi:hypothetical protein